MPNNATRFTIARQWELLKLLPSRLPGLTSTQLQQALAEAGHKTSKRTVERDLNELSTLFPLQCNDKGMPYGWYWQPEQSAALPGVTLGEALTLQLVEHSIRPLVPRCMLKSLEPRFNEAHQKLKSLARSKGAASWVEKVASVQPSLQLLAPDIPLESLEQIQQALLEERQVQVRYRSLQKGKTGWLELNPLGLVQRGLVTYLVATAVPYSDVRLYALHRCLEANVLEPPCQVPEGFSLTGYIDSGALQFGGPRTIQMVAWVDAALSQRLEETPLSDDMALHSQVRGGALLTATVKDSWELMWWLLSQAGSIYIQEPASLRSAMLERLQQGLDLARLRSNGEELMALEPDKPEHA